MLQIVIIDALNFVVADICSDGLTYVVADDCSEYEIFDTQWGFLLERVVLQKNSKEGD